MLLPILAMVEPPMRVPVPLLVGNVSRRSEYRTTDGYSNSYVLTRSVYKPSVGSLVKPLVDLNYLKLNPFTFY